VALLKERIDEDLKQALLAGDKTLASTLRLLKSAILYAEVDKRGKGEAPTEEDITNLLFKEAKKRQESADLYKQAGSSEREQAELAEKQIIEAYLPKQLADEEINEVIRKVINELGGADKQKMGQIIGMVKQRTGGSAGGATIAKLVNEALSTK
jgi:uncharacterized protein